MTELTHKDAGPVRPTHCNSTALFAALAALTLVFLAISYSRNFTWANEISLWSNAVSGSPLKARPHNELGLIYAKARIIDAALFEIETANRLNPYNYLILTNLGNIYSIVGRNTEAMQAYKTVIKYVPNHINARYNLAALYMRSNMKNEAILELEAILNVNPNDREAAYLLMNLKEKK